MKIQAVTTCVNYSDYLVHTMLANKIHFDDYVVMTTKDDDNTQGLCKHFGVRCIATDFGEVFNKGIAINAGIKSLNSPDWIVLVDSDIVLPTMTRHILENMHLHEQHIYGIDRMDCVSKAEWETYQKAAHPQHENSVWIHPGPWKTSTRVMSLKHGGWLPMGFFQMFNANADVLHNNKFYPEDCQDAGNSDLRFAARWPRSHRHLLPEIVGIHLMTDDVWSGVNWKGRKTKDFT